MAVFPTIRRPPCPRAACSPTSPAPCGRSSAGTVLELLVAEGEAVAEGQDVVVIG
ncbi:MAG: hypothetical protein MUC86_17040 [Burkholderiaceae bacterium]|nr:hypothetical protein [Burkholderiaceae bacterium]